MQRHSSGLVSTLIRDPSWSFHVRRLSWDRNTPLLLEIPQRWGAPSLPIDLGQPLSLEVAES